MQILNVSTHRQGFELNVATNAPFWAQARWNSIKEANS